MLKFNNSFFVSTIVVCISQLILSIDVVPKQLPITVYYESLCPDSVRFIRTQLYPTWKELGQYLDITFVPFGKSASVNGGEKFECQHGPKECVGNKIQSCALNQLIERNDLQVEFVNCFMTPGPKAKDCAALVGANWDAIKECHGSSFGTQLQLQAESFTAGIQPKFIPTVVFNGVFDQSLQDLAQDNFRGIVCNYLTQYIDKVC